MLINSPNISGSLNVSGNTVITGSLTTSIAALNTPATTFLTSNNGTIRSRTAAQTLSDIGAQASGSYLTISSATGSYVPYTGATGTVNLGYNPLVASRIRIDGNAPTAGSHLGFKQATSVDTGDGGYTSISTFGTNTMTFVFAQPTGFKRFSFNVFGITQDVSGGRVYSMPDESGTLALTSNLGSYLPLTGGGAITGSLIVTGGITGNVTGSATTASYVEYSNVANKPTLLSGSVQIRDFGIFATTGSNQFNGNQAITGSLTTTGTIVAQTLNVQQVTSSIVYSSGSNIFGNSVSNIQQFTGSLQVSGSSHYLLGSVGVGITSPLSRFHINTGTDQNFRVRPGTDVGATNGVALNSRTDDDGSLQQLTLRASDVIMLTSGNVGIGTASPNGKLRIQNDNSTVPSLIVRDGGTPTANLIEATSNAYGNSFIVTATGNVLVGATTGRGGNSTSHLFKQTSGDVYFELMADTSTAQNDILFSPGSTGAYGIVGYDHSDNSMRFFANSSERMRITSGGALLINTTSTTNTSVGKIVNRGSGTSDPDLTLNNGAWTNVSIGVEPALYLSSNVVAATGAGGSSQTAKGGIGFEYYSSTSPTELSVGIFGTPTVSSNVRFWNGTERMRITSGGNVLIGTTTDNGQRLQVNGNLRIDNTLSSPGNLIETAGLNVYLRPASGYRVFMDTGNGLTVTGDIVTGNSVQFTRIAANSNITTSITFDSTNGFWANNAIEILVSRANNLAPSGMSKILVSMNQLNSSLSSVSTTTLASLGTGVSISTSVSGATITITLQTHTDSASRSVAHFNVISYYGITVS